MPRISARTDVIAVEAAGMRGNQAAQKTRHLWNGPSRYLKWRRAYKPEVARVGFQVILKIKCHNVIERQEL